MTVMVDSKKLRISAITCFVIGLIFFSVSLVSANWAWVNQSTTINQQGAGTQEIKFTYTYGLFATCFSSHRCVNLGWDLSSALLRPVFATRVLMIITTCNLLFCLLAEAYIMVSKKSHSKYIMTFTGLLELVAGLLVLCAVVSFMVTFNVNTDQLVSYNYGYCFYLAWLAIICLGLCGALTAYEPRSNPPQAVQRANVHDKRHSQKFG